MYASECRSVSGTQKALNVSDLSIFFQFFRPGAAGRVGIAGEFRWTGSVEGTQEDTVRGSSPSRVFNLRPRPPPAGFNPPPAARGSPQRGGFCAPRERVAGPRKGVVGRGQGRPELARRNPPAPGTPFALRRDASPREGPRNWFVGQGQRPVVKAAAVGARRAAWSAASAPEEGAERGRELRQFFPSLSGELRGWGSCCTCSSSPAPRQPPPPPPPPFFWPFFFLRPLWAVRTHPRRGGGARSRVGVGDREGPLLEWLAAPESPRPPASVLAAPGVGTPGRGRGRRRFECPGGLPRNVPQDTQGRSRPTGAAGEGSLT